MPNPARRLPDNAAGDFYVDSTCIDCATCRWMAPDTFDEVGDHSRVWRQPEDEAQRQRALMALVACPTASIGTMARHDFAPVRAAFPDPIAENVYHCGYHAEESFGATSYLIVRPSGNVLIDSPRFAGPLVRRLEELGGVKTMFLTHQDDVAFHAKFRAHFGCERILHADDVKAGTRDVERRISGTDPVVIDDDLTVIPTPGHSRGSACLLYRDRFLFTGDHLAFDPERRHVYAFRSACWYDWETQIRSVEALRGFRFEWILPGHGDRCHFPAAEMAAEIDQCIDWMKNG